MRRYVVVVPAYGRDYKSKAAVLADWAAGRDFRIEDLEFSGYVNIGDKPAGVTLQVRYANLAKVVEIP